LLKHRLLRRLFYLVLFLAAGLLVTCRRAPASPAFATPTPVSPSPVASETALPTLTSLTADISALPLTPTPVPTPTLTHTPMPFPRGGRVVEVGLAGVSTLNPLLAADDDDLSRAVGGLLFDGLLRVHPQTAALTPGLALDWRVSDDGRTFTFHLRPGVTWHDGRPFSAADVTFTLAVAGDPEGPSPFRFALAGVSQAMAPDSMTVVVTFDEPGCDALYAVGRVPILPRHLLEGQGLAEAAFNQRPVGTGPFLFAAWKADGSLVLNANQDYWAGRPHLDGWLYRLAPDMAGLQEDLRLGRAHLARLPDGLEVASLPEAFHVLSYPADRWYFLALNNDHPALRDGAVRRALALALDRERLLAAALGGQGALMDTPWLATHWAIAGASLTPLAYAPGQARQLLAEAGWRDTDGDGLLDQDGRPLHVDISANLGNPARERIALLAQQYWHAMGVSAQVEALPWGTFVDDLFRHAFDVGVFDWPLEPGPDQTWLWAAGENGPGTGFNFVSYEDAQVDRLLKQGRTAPACDPARRAAAYRDLAVRLAADQPYIFLFVAHRRLGVAEALVGPQPGPYGRLYWNVTDWWLEGSETE
jgi:peptide/nickel transport system substrate-binding protein